MKRICLQLARMGHQVKMTPRLHYLSDDYQHIYANLIDTRYYRKCPDFEVDGLFYEFEGFIKPWNKRKVKSMISHGLEQSSRIVIKNTKGCSDRFIRRAIMARRNLPNQNIDEVWIYEKGKSGCSIRMVSSTTKKTTGKPANRLPCDATCRSTR